MSRLDTYNIGRHSLGRLTRLPVLNHPGTIFQSPVHHPRIEFGANSRIGVSQSTSQPTNQSTSQPVNQSTSQPVNQSTSRLIPFLLFVLLFPLAAAAQPVNPEIRIAVREDDQAVYVFHTAMPPVGHGFNIYRRGESQERFERLNEDPVRGVASGAELRALLGTLYDDIENTTRQTTANGTLTKLRSDTKTANLLTFIYPQVAEALGRVFVDTGAPVDAPATYRIEFVDALDEPTGQTLEHTALLLPHRPDAPTQLRAQNQGNRITLYWRFISPNETADDKVIRFEAFRIDPTTNQHQRLHDNVILRNNALFEYALTFETATTGQTEQLYVRSIDISGQASEPSVVLRYDALDLDPPRAVVDVSARVLNNQRVQVRWQVSDETDVAGFHLYRSTDLMNESGYVRINRDLLSLNENVYNDTLAAGDPGPVYYYRVTAVDGNGNEGPLSTAAMALVEDLAPPASPENLTAAWQDSGRIALRWSAVMPDDFDTFMVFRVPVGPDAPAIPVRLNAGRLAETRFVDEGIAGAGFQEGATYRFSVLSADRAGNFSEPVFVDARIPDATAPGAPNGAQAYVDTPSRIAVLWNPSPAPDVMRYTVYRRERGTSRLKAFPVDRQTIRFEDDSVVNGVSYEYWVTAADSAGNESPRTEPFAIQMRDDTPPRQVRNVRATASGEQGIALTWEPVPSFDLAGYRIYRAGDRNGLYSPLNENLTLDSSWFDEDAPSGTWYRIHAVDTSGNESTPSQPVRATPPAGQ